MPCSQPGPAQAVTVPPWTPPAPPSTPTGLRESHECVSGSRTQLRIRLTWNPVQGATHYKIYHPSGQEYGTTSSNSFEFVVASDWFGTFGGAVLTVCVAACNAQGCSQPATVTISASCVPTCPTPPNPTPIRSYFENLGCTVDFTYSGGVESVTITYYSPVGPRTYTFVVDGVNCWYSGSILVTSPSKALEAARALDICR